MPMMPKPLAIWMSEGDLGMIALMIGMVVLMIAATGLVRLVAYWRRGNPTETEARMLDARTRRQRLALLGIGVLIAGLLGAYFFVTELKPTFIRRAADAVVLTRAEMWSDAISMFEEKLHIRFHYRNRTHRELAAFHVAFELHEQDGRRIIKDELSITNRVPPGGNSSWTEEYWSTGPQGFALEDWEALTHKDISDYRVEWKAINVVFADGTIFNNDIAPAQGGIHRCIARDSSDSSRAWEVQ